MSLRRLLAANVPAFAAVSQLLANRKLRRFVAAAPARSIRELGENELGRLTGTVVGVRTSPLVAPLSRRECVYWTARVLSLGGKNGRTPHIIAEPADATSFVLEQEGHRAVINPRAATIGLDFDFVSACRGPYDADEHQAAMLRQVRLMNRDWFGTASLEFTEGVIAIGSMITVVGAGIREPDPDGLAGGAYRDAGQTRLRLIGTDRFPLWITDKP